MKRFVLVAVCVLLCGCFLSREQTLMRKNLKSRLRTYPPQMLTIIDAAVQRGLSSEEAVERLEAIIENKARDEVELVKLARIRDRNIIIALGVALEVTTYLGLSGLFGARAKKVMQSFQDYKDQKFPKVNGATPPARTEANDIIAKSQEQSGVRSYVTSLLESKGLISWLARLFGG